MFVVLIGLPVSPATALTKTLQLVMNDFAVCIYMVTLALVKLTTQQDLDLKWKNIQTNHEIRCMYT